MSQEYVATDPNVVVGALTEPWVGLESGPQSARTQAGTVPLQVPLYWQVRVAVPDRLYPTAHEYVAVDPYVVRGAITEPLAVPGGASQFTRAQVGAVPLQVPSLWQVRVTAPERLYPVLQEYVAVELGVFVGAETEPFVGSASAGQSGPGPMVDPPPPPAPPPPPVLIPPPPVPPTGTSG